MTRALARVAALLLLCAAARAQHVEIRGRVEAPSGEPIAGATARLADAPGAVATSGEGGRYRVAMDLSGPAPAELRLVLSAPGRVERTIWLPTDAGLSIPVGTHVLWAGGALAGVVLDEEGKPLAELDFAVLHGDGLRMPARTDAAGRFRVEPISAGLLRFAIDGDAERHLEADEPPAIRFGRTAEATLRRVGGAVLPFPPEWRPSWGFEGIDGGPLPRARGRVTSRGAPVVGARVAVVPMLRASGISGLGLWGPRAPEIGEGITREDGRFEIAIQKQGWFVVRAESPGFGAAESARFDAKPGTIAEDLRIELSRAGSIEGRVLAREGDDPEGILVGACRNDGFPLFRRARADGSFRFDGLGSGEWRVRTFADELPRGRPVESWGSSIGEPEDLVAVAPGETERVDLDRRELVTVRGRVEFEGWEAAEAESYVRLRASGGGIAAVPLHDAEGWFVLRCTAAKDIVLGANLAISSGAISILDRRSLSSREFLWIVGGDSGRVMGRFAKDRRRGARAVDGSSGSLLDGRSFSAVAWIRDDDTFEFPSLPAGSWTFRAIREGDSDNPVSQPIDVRAGETAEVEIP